MGIESHPLKDMFKQRILDNFLHQSEETGMLKWLPIFSQLLQPINLDIAERVKDINVLLMRSMRLGSKAKQIYHTSVYRTFLQVYVTNPVQIEFLMMPLVGAYSDLLMRNKVGDVIRVSALLALFVPDQYHCIAKAMVRWV